MTTQTNLDVIENDQFVLAGRLSTEAHYADGVTQIVFGFPLTKVLLHTTLEPKNQSAREIRRAEQYLTMPTVAAIELANLILAFAKQSEEQLLRDVNENAKEKVRAILQNYIANSPVEGFVSNKISPPHTVASKKGK
ncbi:MAG: hypothetical protein Q7T29_01180 [Gallionella sp.]|nr:hypothetical protein [Gallionella sp.]